MNIKLEKDGKIGTLTIRQNEVEKRAYIEFEDGSDDIKVYSKDDTDDYIINDLIDYCDYKLMQVERKKMQKLEIYKLLEELNCSKHTMVLIDEDKILQYKDIDDDTLGLIDYSDEQETEFISFEIVKELNDNKFEKADGTILETEIFNPFGGMIIGYKVQ